MTRSPLTPVFDADKFRARGKDADFAKSASVPAFLPRGSERR
jgi:hypothetical protein